ncbi:hypothetical protein, partial [Streptomyces microflavus]|uniref:hypothetical protein n=1 Tax=Streptomyces microflavus TaxID=1919 RepID=UPI00332C6A63
MSVAADQLKQLDPQSWADGLVAHLYVQGPPVIPDLRRWVDIRVNTHFNGGLGRFRGVQSFVRGLEQEAEKKRAAILEAPGPITLELEDLTTLLAARMVNEADCPPLPEPPDFPEERTPDQIREALPGGFQYIERKLRAEQRTYFHLECVSGVRRELTASLMGVPTTTVATHAYEVWNGMEHHGVDRVSMAWFVNNRLGARAPKAYKKGDTKQTAGAAAQAVASWAERADHVLFLTGTPMENRVE